MKKYAIILLVLMTMEQSGQAHEGNLDDYNPCWTTQSRDASESMPCGGGDIGLNVWVENDEVFFYVSKSL